ncbi:MAG: DNA-binding protein [Omnitrophica bacterium RIFOXYB12_FULL_50_7]|nr:MAG: DNA-binding protein [Omnitrophica bacterium RIFOXYB12_FULL_50_7]
MKETHSIIPNEKIEKSIFLIRGQKVMLDRDLAALYSVTTGALNQAVKRNLERFPPDFMFQLTPAEKENWISQTVISNREKMGIRRTPFAFTENGVAMLSSVLRSRKSVLVNIEIMRAFTRLREMIRSHKAIWKKIEEMEKKYDSHFKIVFDTLRQMLTPPTPPALPPKPKGPIGFQPH